MKPPLRHDTTALPILLAMLATGLLTLMDGLLKAVVGRASTIDVVFLRYLFGLVATVPILFFVRPPWPSLDMLRAHAVRALLVVATAFFFITALSLLPIIEAIVFSYLAPLFMALLARMILGEKVSSATGWALALGLTGCVVIALGKGLGAEGFGRDLVGVGAALAAALTYAAAMVLLRARTGSDHIVGIVTLQNVLATLYALPIVLVAGNPVPIILADWPALLGIGVLGTLGHLTFAAAYGRAPAAKVGAVEYTSFIWAAGIGIFAFNEYPTMSATAGAALIVAGSLLLLKKAKPAIPDAAIAKTANLQTPSP
jgi:drug/metabolite transporter (DMT)-like permease